MENWEWFLFGMAVTWAPAAVALIAMLWQRRGSKPDTHHPHQAGDTGGEGRDGQPGAGEITALKARAKGVMIHDRAEPDTSRHGGQVAEGR
jgi:hypothetical protein